MAGACTLWLVPELFIKMEWLRIANLLLGPLAAGCIRGFSGAWRAQNGNAVLRLESFAHGFCFAFGLALVRFVFAR